MIIIFFLLIIVALLLMILRYRRRIAEMEYPYEMEERLLELLGKFKVFEKKDIKNQAELIKFILGLIAAVEKDDVQKFEKMLSQANDDNPSQSQQP